jgi:hypothetical protein
MTAICLLVGGMLRASLPVDAFSLHWRHSVAKTMWEEQYRVVQGQLVLTGASVAGTGAGMEPPPDAVLADGRWKWLPALPPLADLRITYSRFTRDYDVCWKSRCRSLGRLINPQAPTEVVSIQACERPPARHRLPWSGTTPPR